MTGKEQDLEWIRNLDDRFWELRWDSRLGHYWKAPKRERLKEEELTRLHEAILRWDLPVGMCNTEFGFGVGLMIYGPEKPPVYPGTEALTKPEFLVVVSQSHLPSSQSTFDGDDRVLFEDGWRVFSELTHRDQNLELVRRCGLPEPGSKGDYVY